MRGQLPLLFHLAGRFTVFVVIFVGTTLQSVLWLSDTKGVLWFTKLCMRRIQSADSVCWLIEQHSQHLSLILLKENSQS